MDYSGIIMSMHPIYAVIKNDPNVRRNNKLLAINKNVKMHMYMRNKVFFSIASDAVYGAVAT